MGTSRHFHGMATASFYVSFVIQLAPLGFGLLASDQCPPAHLFQVVVSTRLSLLVVHTDLSGVSVLELVHESDQAKHLAP